MSLLHWWKFQDNAASTTVVATVGTNVVTSSANTNALSQLDGPGTAFPRSFAVFDGQFTYVNIAGASLSFASGAPFTFCFWVYFFSSALSGTGGICGTPSGSHNPEITSSGSLSIKVSGASGTLTFSVPTLSANVWYHLMVTRTSGNSVRVFLNGTESSSGGQTLAQTFAPTSVGYGGSAYMKGALCDVRVYDSDESANVAAIVAQKDVRSAPPTRRTPVRIWRGR